MKKLRIEPLDIIITGVGGQGNVLASQLLGMALLDAGYHVTVGETYGLSQRGGSVMSQVRVTSQAAMGPIIPTGRAAAIVSLEPLEALRSLGEFGHPGVMVLTNSRPMLPINVISGEATYPPLDELRAAIEELSGELHWIDATDMAMEMGNPILANVIILGALLGTGILPIGAAELEKSLSSVFTSDKMPINMQALNKGMLLTRA